MAKEDLLHPHRKNSSTAELFTSTAAIYLKATAQILLLSGALAIVTLAGCGKSDQNAQPQSGATPQVALPQLTPKKAPDFDSKAAYKETEEQVSYGARVPNSEAHDKELAFIKEQLQHYTQSMELQAFDSPGYDGVTLHLTNVVASFNPEATDRILILTHWDSRPWADEDTVPANRTQPVMAANDGASGTAVMLELARAMKDDPPPIGVDLLFDDGEDYGKPSIDNLDKYFLGAKYFVKTKDANYSPHFAILLDMVGDKHAEFEPEGNSMGKAPKITQEIWNSARQLGLTTFKDGPGYTIEDDHLPFLEAGIPAVDIIDGDLVGAHTTDPARKYWHTTHDLMEHIGASTLDDIGKLLLYLIYERLPATLRTLS